MLKKYAVSLAVLLLLASAAAAGLLGPGKYRGVVVFDRWDTCYVYSGVYLMYVSEETKEGLRKYEGRPVEIYAKEVFQPVNPGDGRIGKFDLLSPLDSEPAPRGIEGLRLTVVPEFEPGRGPRFALAIENLSGEDVTVDTRSVAPTLLGEKDEQDLFSPSDGKSTARITRCEFTHAGSCYKEVGVEVAKPDGRKTTMTKRYAFGIEGGRGVPESLLVRAGQAERFLISLDVPPGTYDFLFGYGGGVHEARGLASNIVSFQTTEGGVTTLLDNRPLGD
jgi:hypothetical protein